PFGSDSLYEAHMAMSALPTRDQSPILHAHQIQPDSTAAAAAAAAGLELITPFMSPGLGNALLKDDSNILNDYQQTQWDATGFSVGSSYPEFINNNNSGTGPNETS
ncbi:hypothetical protein EV175_006958, partial [Coemansia sp. RSA 1933]